MLKHTHNKAYTGITFVTSLDAIHKTVQLMQGVMSVLLEYTFIRRMCKSHVKIAQTDLHEEKHTVAATLR